jgi:hypothetical protein
MITGALAHSTGAFGSHPKFVMVSVVGVSVGIPAATG